jgi:hypothetical protein
MSFREDLRNIDEKRLAEPVSFYGPCFFGREAGSGEAPHRVVVVRILDKHIVCVSRVDVRRMDSLVDFVVVSMDGVKDRTRRRRRGRRGHGSGVRIVVRLVPVIRMRGVRACGGALLSRGQRGLA